MDLDGVRLRQRGLGPGLVAASLAPFAWTNPSEQGSDAVQLPPGPDPTGLRETLIGFALTRPLVLRSLPRLPSGSSETVMVIVGAMLPPLVVTVTFDGVLSKEMFAASRTTVIE